MITTTRRTRPPEHKPSSGPPRPVSSAPPLSMRPDATMRRWLPAWTGEILLVLVVYFVYDGTRDLRTSTLAVANDNGERFLRWERDLHLSPEHWLNELLWHHPVLAVPSAYYYASLHFIVTPAVLIWLYRRHPDRYRSARTALFAGTLLALVIYWLVPTTPPRLLPGGAFHDILVQVHQWGWWSAQGSAPKGLGSLDNVYAAMPSLHVGWALWSGWLIARHARHRSVRILGAIYPVVTALVVMGTGNHYLFDALGGIAVIAVGAGVSAWLQRGRSLAGLPRLRVAWAERPQADDEVARHPDAGILDSALETDDRAQKPSVCALQSPRPD